MPARDLQDEDPWDAWLVVPWVPPPPIKVILLPGSIHISQFVERVLDGGALGY